MKNRIFSLLTAVTFFLTLLPAPALAGQAGAEAPMLLSENNVPYLDCDGDG